MVFYDDDDKFLPLSRQKQQIFLCCYKYSVHIFFCCLFYKRWRTKKKAKVVCEVCNALFLLNFFASFFIWDFVKCWKMRVKSWKQRGRAVLLLQIHNVTYVIKVDHNVYYNRRENNKNNDQHIDSLKQQTIIFIFLLFNLFCFCYFVFQYASWRQEKEEVETSRKRIYITWVRKRNKSTRKKIVCLFLNFSYNNKKKTFRW